MADALTLVVAVAVAVEAQNAIVVLLGEQPKRATVVASAIVDEAALWLTATPRYCPSR